MRYFRRFWSELRGDEYDGWGTCTWYFEVGADRYPARQMQRYADGTVLLYDSAHPADAFGGLSDQPLDLSEFAAFEIGQHEFDTAWREARARNR